VCRDIAVAASYTHLMEGSSERTKRAIDSVFKATSTDEGPEDSPRGNRMTVQRQHLFPEMDTIVAVADSTLVALGSIAERRWGLFTTAQAEAAGVARKQLSRMASAGAIERVIHGVYRMPGSPTQEHEAIYATWLALGGATAPRADTGLAAVVAAGTTAALAHGIGAFFPGGYDFIVPNRRGTRLPGVRLRTRTLERADVIPVAGLPTLTVERTIADLIEIGTDESLVADALRDAARSDKLVAPGRLVDYLSPIAKRRKTTGRVLADNLFELAGVSPEGSTRG
jgi:predicted transcriptional regulator of viral defense system